MRMYLLVTGFLFFVSCRHTTKPEEGKNQLVTNNAVDTIPAVRENNMAAANTQEPVAKAKLIVPGISIGLTALDEKGESIAKKLGTPDDGDAAMGKAISTWYSKSDKAHSTTIYFTTNFGDKEEASRVQQVRITSPYFYTKEKLSVGSAFEDIKTVFPAVKKTGSYPFPADEKQTVNVYDDSTNGICFEIDPSNKCIGITIHKLKDKPFETYLSFLKGYQPVN